MSVPASSVDQFAPPLGQMLLENENISEADLTKALNFQGQFGGRLGAILIRIGAVSEQDVLNALSHQLGFEIAERESLPTDPADYLALVNQTNIPAIWWVDSEILAWRSETGTINCICRNTVRHL